MFKVAVCDDDETICSELETIILNYSEETSEQIEVEVFYSGEDLYKLLKSDSHFDLIFLDIELKGLNGIEVGKLLREELHDEITQLVYISSKQEYAMELFENRPFNFLIKDSDNSHIIRVLHKAISLIKSQNNFFEFVFQRNACKIPYRDIVFFESNDKKIILFTTSTTYEFYGKLSDIADKMHSMDFMQIHKSYLINYLYIDTIQTDSVIMSTDIELPISQTYKKGFHSKLLKRRRRDTI